MSEAKKTKQEIRNDEIIKLVMRQTDYDKDKVIEKLKEWDNNYINVIKEYMNPNFQNKKQEKKFVSKNQQVYGEIRNFMDVANRNYEMRKKRSEKIKQIQQQRYLNFLKQKKENADKNNKLNTIVENNNNETDEPEIINV
jgi:hypothetical protein|tara:strand:- start:1 stop:420 length:420 start_codon:yes stop_codon:yes gene_type:complete